MATAADNIQEHYCGPLNKLCKFCKSKNFEGEQSSDGTFPNCCRNGEVRKEEVPENEAIVDRLEYIAYRTAIRDQPSTELGSETFHDWLVNSYVQYQDTQPMQNRKDELCDKARKLCDENGLPDLFVTFTANPEWKEVVENKKPNELGYPYNRIDLICRVFHLKFKALWKELTEDAFFGRVKASIAAIEFQKKGLPHAHICIFLKNDAKFTTVEQIDNFISAELPDADQNLKLYNIVKNKMALSYNLAGLGYPKEIQETTTWDKPNRPLYRRRASCFPIDSGYNYNQVIAPYNPALLLKYNSHINVEIGASTDYIYKDIDQLVGESEHLSANAFQAMWRVLGLPMDYEYQGMEN